MNIKHVVISGNIGVGKTTFVRFLVNSLENKKKIINSDVLSPTFNIVYDYDIGSIKVLHYDLYRLKKYNDIAQLGIFEASTKYIKIIEWPELIKPKPKDRIEIFFKYSKMNNSRKVKIIGFGKWKKYELFKI